MSFSELGLAPEIVRAVAERGYDTPTPIQRQAIPAVLSGGDLLAGAQTGTGKTAGFTLPILQLLSTRPSRHPGPRAPIRALILTPTRELAAQVEDSVRAYGRHLPLRSMTVFGGVGMNPQVEQLKTRIDILVATPGRLLDHVQQRTVELGHVEILVLDEADRMLDMGFIDDIETIVAATPASRQTLLFSATLDGVVGDLAQRMTRAALRIQVDAVSARHDHIEQRMHFVDDLAHKNRLLDHLLRDASIDQALVFTATKRDADTLSDRLNLAGLNAAALHGDMHQGARNRTLTALRRGQLRILVATDVAARGIDVPTITHVFNYDLPKAAEDYIHRIGRTGRAGRSGLAISLVHHAEQFSVRRIERVTRQAIAVEVVAGHEPTRRTPSTTPRPAGKPAWKAGEKRAPAAGQADGRFPKPAAARRDGAPRTRHEGSAKSGPVRAGGRRPGYEGH